MITRVSQIVTVLPPLAGTWIEPLPYLHAFSQRSASPAEPEGIDVLRGDGEAVFTTIIYRVSGKRPWPRLWRFSRPAHRHLASRGAPRSPSTAPPESRWSRASRPHTSSSRYTRSLPSEDKPSTIRSDICAGIVWAPVFSLSQVSAPRGTFATDCQPCIAPAVPIRMGAVFDCHS